MKEVRYNLISVPNPSAIRALEGTFPGCRVLPFFKSSAFGDRGTSFTSAPAPAPQTVIAPVNCAWLVEGALRQAGATFNAKQMPATPAKVFDASCLVDIKELLPAARASLMPFQLSALLYALNAPEQSAVAWHSTGSGKTRTGLLWLLHDSGPGLFVTKSGARQTIREEIELCTSVKPFVLMPPSLLTKKRRLLQEGIIEKITDDPPRITIVGWESISEMIDILLRLPYTSVVFDELHFAASHKRWKAIPTVGAQGEDKNTFRRMTNRSATAARLASNARRRLGMTATFVPDRVRGLWAQLDLIHPGAWGRSPWLFFGRYCDLKRGEFGQLDNRGKSNIKELSDRMSFSVHRVDYATAHASLPAKRRRIVTLGIESQDKPTGFTRELARAQASGAKSMIEVRIAEAASRKKTALIDMALDDVACGHKVLIFTARRADCERIGASLAKKLPKHALYWVAHGGHPIEARDTIRHEYMNAPGPCVLVGTGPAWGESMSLHDTDHAIFAMLPLNVRQAMQWEGRVHRLGGVRKILISWIVAEGTYDEHIRGILLDKLPAVDALHQDTETHGLLTDVQGDAAEIEARMVRALQAVDEDILEMEQSVLREKDGKKDDEEGIEAEIEEGVD